MKFVNLLADKKSGIPRFSRITFGLMVLLAPLLSAAQNSDSLGGVITLGDSLTAGLAGNGRGGFTCAAQGNRPLTAAQQTECKGNGVEGVGGWQPRLKQLADTTIYNHGNSGEQSAAILARLDAAMVAQPVSHVLILAGTNDAIRGSVAVATDNIREMIRRVRAAGKTAIVATLPPLTGSVVSDKNANILQLNANIRDLVAEFDGLVLVDIHAGVVNNWSQQSSGDLIHFGSLGNQTVADLWFQGIVKSLVSATPPVNIAPLTLLLLNN